MRLASNISRGKSERGIVILLVAVVLLFVVGAMAALAIDVVTFYTARSEAQMAADGAALAGARVLANSGLTSTPAGPAAAEVLAQTIATQVATRNEVGGRTLNPGTEVTVTFNDTDPTFNTNPRVTVQTTRADIPTFFARIWGKAQVTVQASATAEAYNPSWVSALDLEGEDEGGVIPVAPICVKPWILPNINPKSGGGPIFNSSTGAIEDSTLLGWQSSTPATSLMAKCQTCTTGPTPTPTLWRYYAGGPTAFPAPSASSIACAGSTGFTPYQLSVAGCVQTPIACNSTVSIDMSDYPTQDDQTTAAVNCLTHCPTQSLAIQGDSIDPAFGPPLPTPFQFLAGPDNPVVQAGAISAGTDIMVSDSLVTVPVYNSTGGVPSSTVTIIGFVQLFLNPDGLSVRSSGPNTNLIRTRIVNLAGCGTGAGGPPILGNGASPVPVRLVSP